MAAGQHSHSTTTRAWRQAPLLAVEGQKRASLGIARKIRCVGKADICRFNWNVRFKSNPEAAVAARRVSFTQEADIGRCHQHTRFGAMTGLVHHSQYQGGPFPGPVQCTSLSSALLTNSTESIAAPSSMRNCSIASFIGGGRSPHQSMT